MFHSIGRFVRCQKSVASVVRGKATRLGIVADITQSQFWEEETRPIPNVSDSVLHVVTQANEHMNWERCHHKVKLIGVVEVGASRVRIGMGHAVQFTLKTHTILEGEGKGKGKGEGDYEVLEDLHEIVIMQEMTRRLALTTLRPGVPVLIVAGIHYRIYNNKNSVSSYIKSHLFLEHFDTLDSVFKSDNLVK